MIPFYLFHKALKMPSHHSQTSCFLEHLLYLVQPFRAKKKSKTKQKTKCIVNIDIKIKCKKENSFFFVIQIQGINVSLHYNRRIEEKKNN